MRVFLRKLRALRGLGYDIANPASFFPGSLELDRVFELTISSQESGFCFGSSREMAPMRRTRKFLSNRFNISPRTLLRCLSTAFPILRREFSFEESVRIDHRFGEPQEMALGVESWSITIEGLDSNPRELERETRHRKFYCVCSAKLNLDFDNLKPITQFDRWGRRNLNRFRNKVFELIFRV